MSTSDSNRNLLFGILALQMDFISREQLVAATSVWLLDKSKPIEETLIEQNALSTKDQQLLAPLVARHIENHNNDAEKSLASINDMEASIREQLNSLEDAELDATLVCVGTARFDDNRPATETAAIRKPSQGERFRILRPHAKGGLGQVSVAQDTEVNREVALKEIQCKFADDPDSRSRFLLEAEITGSLEHPGIVPVYGLGQYIDGRPYYAMRFVRGDSLKIAVEQYHKDDNASESERTVRFRELLGRFVDVCNAIEYAHSRGVIHRDLKPGNIMLGKYGETLVVDWGLAKANHRTERYSSGEENTLRPESSIGASATIAGSVLGTPAYMSPEQAEGRLDELGPKSDVYSLGATLFHLLTGQAPFLNHPDILKQVQKGAFTRPRELQRSVSKQLEAICLKAMRLEQDSRYESAKQLAEDVEKWMADEPVTAWPEPLLMRTRRWMRRHQTMVATSTAALLVATVSLAVGMTVVSTAYQGERMARKQATINQNRAVSAQKAAVRAKKDAEQSRSRAIAEAQAATEVSNFLVSLFQPSKPAFLFGVDYGAPDLNVANMTVREFFEKRAGTIHNELNDDPVVRAKLMDMVGDIYVMLADLERGEKLLTEAYEIRQKHLPNSEQLAKSKAHLGFLRLIQGRTEESEQFVRDSLAIRESLLGPEHPETLETKVLLAFVIGDGIRMGDQVLEEEMNTETQLIREEVLRVRRAQVGDHHPDIANLQVLLSGHYFHNNQRTKALAALSEAMAIYEQSDAERHTGEAVAEFIKGMVAAWTGRRVASTQYFGRGIEKCKEIFGPSHPAALYLERRASEYYEDNEAAVAVLRENLRNARYTYDRQPRVANSMHSLADKLVRAGKFEEAEEMLKEALQILEEAFYKPHWRVANAHYRLAQLYGRLGDQTLMKEHIEQSREEYRKAGIVGYSRLDVEADASLGKLYAGMQKWSLATGEYERRLAENPDDYYSWYISAGWYLLGDDESGYLKHRQKMLERFEGSEDVNTHNIAKACLLRAIDGDELRVATRLADFAIENGRDHTHLRWFQLTKGLAEFRNDRWDEAIRWLHLSQGDKPQARRASILAHLVVALCHHHAGRSDDARKLLDTVLQYRLAPAADMAANPDWQHCKIMRKEAEQLILKDDAE